MSPVIERVSIAGRSKDISAGAGAQVVDGPDWFEINGRPMHLNRFLILLFVLALCSPAEAQQTKKVPRVGFLGVNFPSTSPARTEAFRQGLRELGYVEEKNIVIEWRYAEGKLDRLPALAAELVGLKVEVIVTSSVIATRAAQETTKTIPIVMAQGSDPVGNGFVVSLARPGGNIMGLSTLSPDLTGKQLELLKESFLGSRASPYLEARPTQAMRK